MFDLHLKDRLKHKHMPEIHHTVQMINHLIRDERFWAVVALILLITAIFIMVLVLGPTRISDRQPWPVGYPFFP